MTKLSDYRRENKTMEYVIAIFVGVWISAAGILAYLRIKKDFAGVDVDSHKIKEDKDGDKK